MAISLNDRPKTYTDDRASLPELIGELGGQLVRLAKQEVQLAKAELGQQAKKSAADGVGLLAAATVIHAGLLLLLTSLVAAMALTMPVWQAAMTVGVVLVLLGGGGLYFALGKLRYHAHLEHLPQSLETNGQFLKESLL